MFVGVAAYLSRPWWKVFERPPDAIFFLGLPDLFADLHDELERFVNTRTRVLISRSIV